MGSNCSIPGGRRWGGGGGVSARREGRAARSAGELGPDVGDFPRRLRAVARVAGAATKMSRAATGLPEEKTSDSTALPGGAMLGSARASAAPSAFESGAIDRCQRAAASPFRRAHRHPRNRFCFGERPWATPADPTGRANVGARRPSTTVRERRAFLRLFTARAAAARAPRG